MLSPPTSVNSRKHNKQRDLNFMCGTVKMSRCSDVSPVLSWLAVATSAAILIAASLSLVYFGTKPKGVVAAHVHSLTMASMSGPWPRGPPNPPADARCYKGGEPSFHCKGDATMCPSACSQCVEVQRGNALTGVFACIPKPETSGKLVSSDKPSGTVPQLRGESGGACWECNVYGKCEDDMNAVGCTKDGCFCCPRYTIATSHAGIDGTCG